MHVTGEKLRNLLFQFSLGLFFGVHSWAAVIDGESRQTAAQFFAVTSNPPQEAFAPSGSLYCGVAGIDVTAQLVGEDDSLLTAAHFFFDRSTLNLKRNLENCFWTPFFGPAAGKRIKLRLETLRIYSSQASGTKLKFDYSRDWEKDLAIVRLDLTSDIKLGITAYAIEPKPAAAPEPRAFYLLSSVDGGPTSNHDYSPGLQLCSTRDIDTPFLSGNLGVLYTDCDVQNPGPSGSALLRLNGTVFTVTGILSGYFGKTPGSYSKRDRSTAFVAIDSKAQKWITNYLSEIH